MKNFKVATAVSNVVIILVLVSSFLVAYFAANKKETESLAANAIYKGDEQRGKVALMFNVYERADNVDKIMRIFEEYGYLTTFFVGGCWAAKNADTIVKMHSAGFEIGNHGYLHRDHAKLGYDENVKEIRLTGRLVSSILKDFDDYDKMTLFAPPSGSIGDDMMRAATDLGYKVIMWTRDTIDWRDQDANLIFTRATDSLKSGELVLLHPTDATVAALPRILDYIKIVGLQPDIVSNVI
ncbi:MAG: polysaccharide deacetylase family protein [Clostridia bacterium]|nr:polysaccharide deacetylase family protein [Clostridia bacterium]